MEAQDDQKQVATEAADHEAQLTLALTSASEPLTNPNSEKLGEVEQQVMTNVKATFSSLRELTLDRKTPSISFPDLDEEFSQDNWQHALRAVIESDLTPKQKLCSFFSLVAYRLLLETVNEAVDEQ